MEVVEVHVSAKFYQAKLFIMLTKQHNLATMQKTILPSLRWAVIIGMNLRDWCV